MSPHRAYWILLAACAVAFAAGAQDLPAPLAPIPPEMRLSAAPTGTDSLADGPSQQTLRELGRLLFFDPILSNQGDVACATCHHPAFGWADGRARPIGVGGEGVGPKRLLRTSGDFRPLLRNVPSLLNVRFNGLVAGSRISPTLAPMFWDSRVVSLEAQALEPIRTPEEMLGKKASPEHAVAAAVRRLQAIPEYARRFSDAFPEAGEESISAHSIATALAAFERTLVAMESPFDRFLRGIASALTAEQKRGMLAFQSAGCIQCHGGPMFSDFKLHSLGIGEGAATERRDFRTPTLRNLRFTAPYMHDGSVRTIEATLDFYDRLADAVTESFAHDEESKEFDPLLRHLNLQPADLAPITAFLDALNDEAYDRSMPDRVPSGLPTPR